MARFIFPLQNILNMKEKLEDQAKNEYGLANMRLVEAQEEYDRLEHRMELAKESLKEAVSSVLDIRDIKRREEAVEILRMYVRQQKLIVLQREKELEVARKHLAEAMIERKTYEKLREKAFEKFLAEENVKEQKEVDELVSYRYSVKAENA